MSQISLCRQSSSGSPLKRPSFGQTPFAYAAYACFMLIMTAQKNLEALQCSVLMWHFNSSAGCWIPLYKGTRYIFQIYRNRILIVLANHGPSHVLIINMNSKQGARRSSAAFFICSVFTSTQKHPGCYYPNIISNMVNSTHRRRSQILIHH